MGKNITRIVLTGGPAAGKTTLISRILKEFKQEDGWKVITIPETATELISGFGIGPFEGCMSMEEFQYFVIDDQLHKEKLALKAAETVPEENILIIYDRAVFDDKAYISDEDFVKTLAYFGKTEDELLEGYDAVLHLVSCAKGAEFAYNFGNAARYESVEEARLMDDRTLRAWSAHPAHYIIDNSEDFESKINRAVAQIYDIVGRSASDVAKRKYLVAMPDLLSVTKKYNAAVMEMVQTFLTKTNPNVERRIRRQKAGSGYMYFYTEKRIAEDGSRWVTERPISEKEYLAYLLEGDKRLPAVHKTKYRFSFRDRRMEIDVYPFSNEKAIFFVYGSSLDVAVLPPEIKVLQEVTDQLAYKNRRIAAAQEL